MTGNQVFVLVILVAIAAVILFLLWRGKPLAPRITTPTPTPKPPQTVAPWAKGVLSANDSDALASALQAAENAGMARAPVDLIRGAVSDLGALDRLALDSLAGVTSLDLVVAAVEDFAPWTGQLPVQGVINPETVPALALRSPGALPLAAYLGGGLRAAPDGEAESARDAGLRYSRKAMTAVLWRAEPVARLVFAARAWSEKRLQTESFAAVVTAMAGILREPLAPQTLVAAFREGLTIMPFPRPVEPTDWLWPRRPPYSEWLLPENQAWAHCMFGLHQAFRPPPTTPQSAPPPGSITPATVCSGSIPSTGLEVLLNAPVGGSFGPQEPISGSGEGWGLSVNGSAAEIIAWTAKDIRFVTKALTPGCNTLSWTWSSNWTPDENGVGAACIEALRIPQVSLVFGTKALINNSTRFWLAPAPPLVVSGPSVGQFAASDGSGPTPAEACTPVTISWQVKGLGCQAAAALATVRLIRERQVAGVAEQLVLVSDGEPQATVSQTLDTTATYRLEVTSRDGAGNPCGTSEAVITVARQKRIRLNLPPRVIAGQPATGTVSVSCPAPRGGLLVSFAVAPDGALGVPAVRIQEGATTAPVTLTAALCGTAAVTATAPGHTEATASTCGLVAPTITAVKLPAAMPACEAFSVEVVAKCVTQAPELKAFAVAAGERTPLVVRAPAAGACGRSATLMLDVPALAPDTYTIVLEDVGGTVAAAQSFTVTPNPRIVSAPSVHSVTIVGSRCPRPRSTLAVTVRGADSVAFEYAHPDGAITRTVTSPTSGCAVWRAEFTAVFDRKAIVTATPMFGAISGSAATIAVDLEFDPSVASAIELFAADTAAANKRATNLERVEKDSNTTIETSTPESPIPDATVRRLVLKSCVETHFHGFRPEEDDPNSTAKPPSKVGWQAPTSGPWHGHPDADVKRVPF